ncbi:MAG TPA: CPBP family intramembrane glutamic endopeptidase [Polyangiaceae bacterium]|nr:CPBP family intramembrane glutamic endopeptidase [Polyangiaceae bacterium]
MSSRPLGTLRVTWLVSALALRRFVNRFSPFRRRARGPGRGATPKKAAAGKALLGFLALLFGFQAVTLTAAAIERAARVAEQSTAPDHLFVHARTLRNLVDLVALGACDEGHDPSEQEQSKLDAAFELEGFEHRDRDDRAAYRHGLAQKFRAHCLTPFRASEVRGPGVLPTPSLWYRGAGKLALPKALGVLGLLLTLGVMLQTVAGSGRDLTEVDQRFEWLFAFPVRARSLFLARMLAMALTAPLVWVLIWPFYGSVLFSAGYGLFAVPLGALAALYVGLIAAAVRVLAETTLPRWLTSPNVSRVQAFLGLLGTLSLVPAFAVAYTPGLGWLYDRALRVADGWLYEPLSVPLLLATGGAGALSGAALLVVYGAVFALGAVTVAERMVSNGIVATSGVDPGSRGGPQRAASGAFGLRGVALKELRALLRDRQLRTQAFLVPVLAIGAQILINPSLLRSLAGGAPMIATAAFGTAAFSLLTGALNGLATEGQALWTLYTVPVRLERLLLAKVHVWVGVASSFAVLVLVGLLIRSPHLVPAVLPRVPLVFAGVYLYAMIGLGLGALGTDPLELEQRRRLKPGAAYLFMLLLSLFAYSIYTESLWPKVVELVLSSLLAYALWQKLKDHLPYLLDPTEAPPPSIAVADGVLAALGFFAFQGIFMLLFSAGSEPSFEGLTLAFGASGLLVALASLWFFARSRVPDLMATLGLVRPLARGRAFELRALGIGGLAGGAAAVFGLGYRSLVLKVPMLRALIESEPEHAQKLDTSARVWLTLLAVVAAPLFEEFVFRGILYRGFRRSFAAPLAALMSAVVFALVHPAASALPVFCMAFLAAVVYERFRWLFAPIATHVTYNAVVVVATLWQH